MQNTEMYCPVGNKKSVMVGGNNDEGIDPKVSNTLNEESRWVGFP